MSDPRYKTLASGLVNYSVAAKPGDKVLIEVTDVPTAFTAELIRQVYAAGAYPFVETYKGKVEAALRSGTSEEHSKLLADFAGYRMSKMDCYIGVRGNENAYDLSGVPGDKASLYSRLYSYPVHHEMRVKNTRWVVLRWPNDSMAQLSGEPTDSFEDFYFRVCCMDYAKMDRAMDALKALMDKTDKVRLVAKDTDLTFSIKGIGAVKCSGHMNIPDGEVYSAPVKDSVNGRITYNVPSIENGTKFENVSLEFKNGKIISATGNYPDKINAIFDTDEGARYVGEFAIGVNPFITKAMGDILFDEKISGSIHFTPGCCYDDACNGNQSAVHWDLVLVMTPEFGGGEIWFDDVLIRKDGLFVLPELECLNPDKLK